MKLLFPFLFLLVVGCGYKPSTTYTQNIIHQKVKINFEISPKNPKETIFLKDALIDSVYTIFNSKIDDKNPQTIMNVSLLSFNLTPIDYDKNGFPILYRSYVKLKISLSKSFNKSYIVSGSYDFSISANSIINEEAKLEAFKKASLNALNNFLTNLTIDGAKL